jgi:RNA polymerase sigma factor (sigma-70 family)
MPTPTDHTLLNQIRQENNASFEGLYRLYFPPVASHIRKNKGNEADAEDIFQETIVVLLQKVRQPGFVLTSSLKTYLFAIAKNLWLKRLRDNKLIRAEDFEHLQTETYLPEIQPEKTREEKLTGWLARITENCQRLLRAIFFLQQPMEKLMQEKGWKNKHVAANQQYKCVQQLKKEMEKEN